MDGRGGNVAQFENAANGSRLFASSSLTTIALNTDYTLQLDLNAQNWAGPDRNWDVNFGFFIGSIDAPTVLATKTLSGTLGSSTVSWAGWQTTSVSFNSGVLNTGQNLNIFVTRGSSTSPLIYEYVDNVTVTAVPEPTTTCMLVSGLGATLAVRRRRRANAA